MKTKKMSTRQKIFAVLRTARFVGACAMLGVVVAGALGFGDVVKLVSATAGVGTAVALKAAHLVA